MPKPSLHCNSICVSPKSPQILATYETGDTFDQSSSRGFIEIYGMQSKLAAARDVRAGNGAGF